MKSILSNLHGIRTSFDSISLKKKKRLLQRLSCTAIKNPEVLKHCHELLLFICAYPDNREIQSIAESHLKEINRTLSLLSPDSDELLELHDSGIAGTAVDLSIGFESIRWIAQNFAGDLDVSWDDTESLDELEALVKLCIAPIERDSLLVNDLDTLEWISIAKGNNQTDLEWIVEQVDALKLPALVTEKLFGRAELSLVWRLNKRTASRTLQRFPSRPLFFHSDLQKRHSCWAEEITNPLPKERKLTSKAQQSLVKTVRSALCVRDRETDPVTYTNSKEQHLFCLDRGVDVFVTGLLPDHRLPIESYFGFMAAKNRLPIAYGGSWILGDRAEIGVNVFDSFRGGESQFLFCQIMRAYYGYFGARYFMVAPYQFGQDNPEAIESGAYWFYYRLGFRSVSGELFQLAEREWKKIKQDRTYRTPPRTLRKLATSPLALDLRANQKVPCCKMDVTQIGLKITEFIGYRFGGDREKAIQSSLKKAQRLLHVKDTSNWNPAEKKSFEQFSLITDQIPELKHWSNKEKKDLVSLMRAKGGPKERSFARKVQRHKRLLAALEVMQKE